MNRLPITLAVLSVLSFTPTLDADVIAYWRFEDGALTADSSGNGHTLINRNGAAVWSSNHSALAPGDGSAYFNGAARLYTAANLNLSGVSQLTVEWFAQPQTSSSGFVWSHTYDPLTTSGGLWGLVDGGAATPTIGVRYTQSAGGGTALTATAPIPGGSNPGVWNHYAITLDATDGTLSTFRLYINYVEVGTYTSSGTPGATALVNQVFNIGARQNDALPFIGYIDEIRLSSTILTPGQFLQVVPEPATTSLIGLAALGLLTRSRRAKRLIKGFRHG